MLARIFTSTAAAALALGLAVACSPNAPTATAQATSAPVSADHVHQASTTNEVTPAPAPEPAKSGPVIPNFTLSDQNGKPHELYKMTGAKAIVLVMQGVGCPIVQQITPDLKDLQAAYEAKGITFMMLNSNQQDTVDKIAAEAKSFDIKMPILKDVGQKVAEPLGVERTAEAIVIEPGTWKVLYHGPVNDRLTYGRARAKADNNYVADVLDAKLANKPIAYKHELSDGCIIVFDNRTKNG